MCTKKYLLILKVANTNFALLDLSGRFQDFHQALQNFIRRPARLWDAEAVDGHEGSNAQQQKRDAAVDPLPKGLDLLFTWHLHIVRLLKHHATESIQIYPDAMSRNFWTHIYVYVYIYIYISLLSLYKLYIVI